jgi:hypothetical protein
MYGSPSAKYVVFTQRRVFFDGRSRAGGEEAFKKVLPIGGKMQSSGATSPKIIAESI